MTCASSARIASCLGGLLACAWGAAIAAEPIYRCPDGDGHVMYTSERCRGGVELEVDAGKADPAAIERLHRDVAAYEARANQRQAQKAALQLAAADLDYRRAEEARYAAMQQADYEEQYCDYCGVWGFFPYYQPHPLRPPRPFKPRAKPQTFVPR